MKSKAFLDRIVEDQIKKDVKQRNLEFNTKSSNDELKSEIRHAVEGMQGLPDINKMTIEFH